MTNGLRRYDALGAPIIEGRTFCGPHALRSGKASAPPASTTGTRGFSQLDVSDLLALSSSTIDEHRQRYRDAIRGSLKENFRKIVSRGIPVSGKNGSYQIPIPGIDIPVIKRDPNKGKGIGQGSDADAQ